MFNFIKSFLKRRRDVGYIGESVATVFLKKNGYRVLERNFRLKHHEIDIIAWDKRAKTLVFVEVKARSKGALVQGYHAAMSKSKRRSIRSCALGYLSKMSHEVNSWRFDVIEVQVENTKPISIQHFENVSY